MAPEASNREWGAGRGHLPLASRGNSDSKASIPPPLSSPIHIGSCAWTYDDWRGSFYAADLPKSRWLNTYAQTFRAVEVDSTFYATPPPETVAHWLEATPREFRFTCKAPKAITHQKRLRDCAGLLEDFLEGLRPLKPKLGPIVFQMPPSFAPERSAPVLREFLGSLPSGWKFAIEFRHADWHQPRFVKMLEDHNVCWTWADLTPVEDQAQGPFGFLPETADFLLVRLMGDVKRKYGGDSKRLFKYREVQWPRAKALESWALRLSKHVESVKEIYVSVSNHYEGFSPATMRTLAGLLGETVVLPETAGARPEKAGQLTLL